MRRRAEHVAMHIPTPTRGGTPTRSRYSEQFDSEEVPLKEAWEEVPLKDACFEGTFDDDGTIFEIGSDDEEENVFQTHSLGETGFSPPSLKETLSTWKQPGCSPPKLSKLGGIGQVGLLKLGSLESLQGLHSPRQVGCPSAPSTPSTFYMGTPRVDDM